MGERRDTLPSPEAVLTVAEQEVLDFICQEIIKTSRFPSSKDIGEATGLSLVRVRVVLCHLEDLGYVKKMATPGDWWD